MSNILDRVTDLLNLIERAINSGAGSSSGGSGGSGSSSAAPAKAPGGLKEGIASVTPDMTKASAALNEFKTGVYGNLEVWRTLSKTGAGFNNDIIGMTVAAAQSRVSLADFSNIITENSTKLSGLGGSVTKGAEAFTRLSKNFFDSGFDRGLRELGYTSAELNEILIYQAGTQKSAFSEKAGTDKMAMQAAADMASEMDLIAKLTGKSRKEQMEELNLKKVDGQAEAKLRQLTRGKSEKEAAEIETQYRTGLQAAILQGTEKSYKEFYATGTYLSEAAQAEAAVFGKQIQAQEDSIKAMKSGDFVKAAADRERAMAENLKNQSNDVILTMSTLGAAGGVYSETAMKSVESQLALYNAVNSSKDAYEKANNTVITWDQALKISRDNIKKEQIDTKKSGATEALITVEKTGQDFKAGIATAIEAQNANGQSIANAIRDVGKDFVTGVNNALGGLNLGKSIGEAAQKGQTNVVTPVKADQGTAIKQDAAKTDTGGVIGEVTRTLSDVLNKGVTPVTGSATNATPQVIGTKTTPGTPLQVRAKGGPVDSGTPYLVGEEGKAEIFVPKAAGDIVPMDKVGSIVPDLSKQTVQGASKSGMSLNMSDISKTISTSISSIKTDASSSGIAASDVDSISNKITSVFESKISDIGSLSKQIQAVFEAKIPDMTMLSKQLQTDFESKVPDMGSLSKQLKTDFESKVPDMGSLSKQLQTGITSKVVDEDEAPATLKLPTPEEYSSQKFTPPKMGSPTSMWEEHQKKMGITTDVKFDKVSTEPVRSDISKEIGNISSVSNAVEIPAKTQTNAGKNAELEMAELQKKFDTDWSSRKGILIEGMALEDRKYSKVQAAMASDADAIKIKEDYLKQKQAIEDKISNENNKAIADELAQRKVLQDEKIKIDAAANTALVKEQEVTLQKHADLSKELSEKEIAARKETNSAIVKTAANTTESITKSKTVDTTTNSSVVSDASATKKLDLNTMKNIPGINWPSNVSAPSDAKPTNVVKSTTETAKPNTQTSAEKPVPAKPTPKTTNGKPEASLNEVVESLNRLNSQMAQLISQQTRLMDRQISATRSNSNNVYSHS